MNNVRAVYEQVHSTVQYSTVCNIPSLSDILSSDLKSNGEKSYSFFRFGEADDGTETAIRGPVFAGLSLRSSLSTA